MEKFLIEEYQDGGCDYTIGCGTRTFEMEAENMEDALAKYAALTEEDYRQADGSIYSNPWVGGDYRPNSAIIYEIVAKREIPFDIFAAKVQGEIDGYKQKDIEEEEKAELARLQAKYNNG